MKAIDEPLWEEWIGTHEEIASRAMEQWSWMNDEERRMRLPYQKGILRKKIILYDKRVLALENVI